MPTRSPELTIGSDECGLGAYAGPLMVCAAMAPADWVPPKGLRDSKKTKAHFRESIYPALLELDFVLMTVSCAEIDRCGLGRCVDAAHAAALRVMTARHPSARVVVDGTRPIPGFPRAKLLARADSIIPAVMAAANICKVNRDYLMMRYHEAYPAYGFDTNAGYCQQASSQHAVALRTHGPCPLHRRSFRPIRDLLQAP